MWSATLLSHRPHSTRSRVFWNNGLNVALQSSPSPERLFFFFFSAVSHFHVSFHFFFLWFCPKFITSLSYLQKPRRISDLVKMKMCMELLGKPRFLPAMNGSWLGRGERGGTGAERFTLPAGPGVIPGRPCLSSSKSCFLLLLLSSNAHSYSYSHPIKHL